MVILSHYYMPFYENHYYGSVLLHGHSHMSPESDLERQITANLISQGITERIYNIGCMLSLYGLHAENVGGNYQVCS